MGKHFLFNNKIKLIWSKHGREIICRSINKQRESNIMSSKNVKQFIGLYAVGAPEEQEALALQIAHTAQLPTKPVYLGKLAASEPNQREVYHLPLGLMKAMERGLYIGVVTIGPVVEVKVIPMKLANQDMFEEVIDPLLRVECVKAIDKMFGAGEPGEATPAYVNQDPT